MLFRGGSSIEVFSKIAHLIGGPDADFVESLTHEPSKMFVASLLNVPAADLRSRVGRAEAPPSEEALDLMRSLLVYATAARPDASAALDHPFFQMYTDIDCGPTCATTFVEPGATSIPGWKELILGEITAAQQAPADLEDTTVSPAYIDEA